MKALLFILLALLLVLPGCGNGQESAGEEGANTAVSGQELVESRCINCHNLDKIYQVRDKDQWQGIVEEMIGLSPGLLNNMEKEEVVLFLQENYGQ